LYADLEKSGISGSWGTFALATRLRNIFPTRTVRENFN
jgi:hypothetical protein